MSDAPSATELLPDPSARLEAAFDATATRMCELPFFNPALRVEAVGFAPWRGYWLGVMVTPWSMNLMLLARDRPAWRGLAPGEKRRYVFPAGEYDFISGHDPAIGEYFACSLFSPVLEFADHATARETARQARSALLDAGSAEAPETRQAGEAAAGPLRQIAASLNAPLSRRDLFHGRFGGTDR